MKPKAVDYVHYEVSDLQKAVAFYRDVLGMKLTAPGEFWAELEVGSTTIGLCVPPPGVSGPPGCAVALAVDDVSEAVEELRAKGVTIVAGPEESPVCYWAIIKDMDGNFIWIHHRKDGTCG
jgi:predicted enzyme related to lactoylglutathione lyase